MGNITSSITPLLGEEERVRIIPLTLQSDVIHSKYLSTVFREHIKTPIFIDFFGVLSVFQRERYNRIVNDMSKSRHFRSSCFDFDPFVWINLVEVHD